jgi:hypothetical protein
MNCFFFTLLESDLRGGNSHFEKLTIKLLLNWKIFFAQRAVTNWEGI